MQPEMVRVGRKDTDRSLTGGGLGRRRLLSHRIDQSHQFLLALQYTVDNPLLHLVNLLLYLGSALLGHLVNLLLHAPIQDLDRLVNECAVVLVVSKLDLQLACDIYIRV